MRARDSGEAKFSCERRDRSPYINNNKVEGEEPATGCNSYTRQQLSFSKEIDHFVQAANQNAAAMMALRSERGRGWVAASEGGSSVGLLVELSITPSNRWMTSSAETS